MPEPWHGHRSDTDNQRRPSWPKRRSGNMGRPPRPGRIPRREGVTGVMANGRWNPSSNADRSRSTIGKCSPSVPGRTLRTAAREALNPLARDVYVPFPAPFENCFEIQGRETSSPVTPRSEQSNARYATDFGRTNDDEQRARDDRSFRKTSRVPRSDVTRDESRYAGIVRLASPDPGDPGRIRTERDRPHRCKQ
jgi:hypothetical protein